MDPGEYETNTLLINNVSTVTFKIYEPVVSSSPPFDFSVSDVEYTLRNDGHLVYADPLRRAIWCFSLPGQDGSLVPPTEEGDSILGPTIVVCGYSLAMIDEGTFEPISLLKTRIMTPNAMNTPSSSSPSAPGLDASLRAVTTPGGGMSSTSFSNEMDLSSSLSSMADPKSYGSIPTKDIYEYFVSSVLAALSQRFCSKANAIPLDSKTFILPSEAASTDPEIALATPSTSILASLRVHLTTAGSLLIGLYITRGNGILAVSDGLGSAAPPSMGSTVLAAPLGIFGTFQGLSEGDQCYPMDAGAGQSPDTQLTRLRPDLDKRLGHWRNTCLKLLETRGISSAAVSKSPWLSIHFLRRRPNESRADGKRTPSINPQTYIMWPAVLCYRKRTSRISTVQETWESALPSTTAIKDEFDAMKNAKTWFLSNAEREELLARRKGEREAVTASKDVVETDARLPQINFSPHASRRTSNPAVAGGAMYPTPPDGVQNVAGATPNIDGTTSSPGNPAPSNAMVDIDTSMTAHGNSSDSFGDGWDGTDTRREQSFNQENWDLNNDVFVETDITDADFNFFDEQPGAMDVSVADMPDMDTGLPSMEPSEPPARVEPQISSATVTVKAEGSPAPPVFAKPELKHARSILGREMARTRPSQGIKRQSSPFDPVTVYKRLKASLESGNATSTGTLKGSSRRGSAFDRLDFDRSFAIVNRKYEHNGRFDFRGNDQEDQLANGPVSPPTTNYLRRHGKSRTTAKDLPRNLGAQIAGMAGTVESGNAHHDLAKAEESTSDADDISLVSDQDDMSEFSDEPSSPTKMIVRRRRFGDDNESIAPSTRDVDIFDDQAVSNSLDLSRLSINDTLDISATRYFADTEPVMPSRPLPVHSDEEFIMAAQILTEQAVSGRLVLASPELTHDGLDVLGGQREVMHRARSSLQILQAILPPTLQTAVPCQLRQLIDVQDVPLLATPSRIQPRPPAGGPEQRPSLVQISPPHLELRRYETKLSVLPTAVNFWESLGLGPSQGPKDIHSVCVFPNLEGMSDSAGVFLDRLRIVYESLKLGSFERMPSSQTILNGLLPFDVEDSSNSPISTTPAPHQKQQRVDDMAKLAVALFNLAAVPKNFVIFFVYTPEQPNTIVESCLAFQRMFELYRRALTERKKAPALNEVVLQLVPLNMVATPTSMVVLPPSDCIRVCLEVYDRCTLFGGPMPAPSIVLEQQPITQGINFQLRNQPSANILQENSMMHIAYAQSTDERWITAAWTDNRGCKQMTASYCLGKRGKPLSRSFTDVAHDIWTTTHDLTSIWKVHWRIVITKVGPMDPQEISDWTTLAQTEMKSSVTLALLTVNTKPSLQLIPSIPKVPMATQSAFYTTPASTPQPSTMSPEHVGNPPTPKGGLTSGGASTPGADNNATEAEADASLVDVNETTWGAVSSHRLNTSNSLTDPSPALISGYLIKRCGSRADDPPAVMEINVLHCDGNPRVHEMLLREMLSVFRGLGTIARARSVTDKEGDVRPWHVAAAEKGVQALYQLM